MYSNFEEIVHRARSVARKQTVAVAAAEDQAVLDAALRAEADGIAETILVGDGEKIRELLGRMGRAYDPDRILNVPAGQAGEAAVALVRDGAADFLMKGMMDTKDILRPVVKKENGLRTGRVMSHFALNQLPGYHKLIVNTDGGMLLYPTLEEKKGIVENAVSTLRALGYDRPKVAVLAGVEKVNPAMEETLDAQALAGMGRTGELTGCLIEGPVSYDVAMSREIAGHKGVPYTGCGDYDVLIAPNLAAGNILGKCWSVTAGARMAGIIVGAKVPVVLTSRGSSADEKYLSIALASAVSAGKETGV